MAIGHTRIKEYSTALKYTKSFLQIEPNNQQVLSLEDIIKKEMERKGMLGMAMAGGASLVVGGLVILGMALAKNK